MKHFFVIAFCTMLLFSCGEKYADLKNYSGSIAYEVEWNIYDLDYNYLWIITPERKCKKLRISKEQREYYRLAISGIDAKGISCTLP